MVISNGSIILNDNTQFWDGSFLGKVNVISRISEYSQSKFGGDLVMISWKVFIGDSSLEFKMFGNMISSITRHYSSNLSMADNFKDKIGLNSTGTICIRFNNNYYTLYRSLMVNGKIIFDIQLNDLIVYRGRNKTDASNNPFLADWELLAQVRKIIVMRLCIFNKLTTISQVKLRYKNIDHNTSIYIRKFLNKITNTNYKDLSFEYQSPFSRYLYPVTTVDCDYEIGTGNFITRSPSLSTITRNLIFPNEVKDYLYKAWRLRFGRLEYPTLENMSLIIELFDWRDVNDVMTTVSNVSNILPKDLQDRILNIGMNNIK